MSEERDSRTTRVSDAEREHVTELLSKAVGRGLLSLDEFTTRVDTVLVAQTRGELNVVLTDLPIVEHTRIAAEQPLTLSTGAGTVKQVGRWVVPDTVTVMCGMGSVVVDFSEATCPHDEVTLHATCGSGTIGIVVPRGWGVLMVDVSTAMGTVANKAVDPHEPGLPVLRVHAQVEMGTVKIRYPRGGGPAPGRRWRLRRSRTNS